MAHYTVEYDLPDCPKCGEELKGRMCYQGDGFTKQVRWWVCEECGYETEKLPSDEWWEKYPGAMRR